MRNRSSRRLGACGASALPIDQAADSPLDKGPGPLPPPQVSMDATQVVNRHCTLCEWEAQLIERGLGEDPLCPWCYGPTERTGVVGVVILETPEPGQKNASAASLGRLGGLKGGPARAQKLSAKRRREIASKAARARWDKKQS